MKIKTYLHPIFITFTCLLLITGCSSGIINALSSTKSYTSYVELFDSDRIANIYISIDKDDWQEIVDDPLAEEYYPADISFDGIELKEIGIRTKGNTSLKPFRDGVEGKYSLRIKTNKYIDGQKLLGLNEFVLNNSFDDPSFMREYFTYQALHYLGADAPLYMYANVYLNGDLFGFYLCVEAIDNSFVERITNQDKDLSNLYKAESTSSTLSINDNLSGFEHKSGNDEDMEILQKLVNTLDDMPEGEKGDIEDVFDVDSILKAHAVNMVMGNFDSYSGQFAHNYYLLENDGVIQYISWDLNMSFGGFDKDDGSSVTRDLDYVYRQGQRPLLEKILAVDEYHDQYIKYVKKLINYYEDFPYMAEKLADKIRPYVEADPNKLYTTEMFEENIIETGQELGTDQNGNEDFVPNQDRMNPGGQQPGNFATPEDGEHPQQGWPGGQPPNGISQDEFDGTPPADQQSTPFGQQPRIQAQQDDAEGTPFPNDQQQGEPGAPPSGQPGRLSGTPSGDQFQSRGGNQPPQGGNMPDNQGRQGDGGRGNMNGNVPSIIDYLMQRIEYIQEKL